jgi:hypothetical protein
LRTCFGLVALPAEPAGAAEWAQPLLDDRAAHGGILFQPFGNGCFDGVEFACARSSCGTIHRRIEILQDGVLARAEMAFDFADGPVLGPVQPMQVVDLFGREDRVILLSGGNRTEARTLLLASFFDRRQWVTAGRNTGRAGCMISGRPRAATVETAASVELYKPARQAGFRVPCSQQW